MWPRHMIHVAVITSLTMRRPVPLRPSAEFFTQHDGHRDRQKLHRHETRYTRLAHDHVDPGAEQFAIVTQRDRAQNHIAERTEQQPEVDIDVEERPR